MPDPSDCGWLFNEKDQVLEWSLCHQLQKPLFIWPYATVKPNVPRTGANVEKMDWIAQDCGCENCENGKKDEKIFRESRAGAHDEPC